MAIAVGILVVAIMPLVIYIVVLQLQLRSINRQLDKRMVEQTRQPISLELINHELNRLTANVNRCLKAEENLRLDRMREEKHFKELIANVSHDLRTPLTAIKGYQQLMAKGTLTGEQKQKLVVAQKYTNELGILIDHFFEYSYLANVEPELNLERINLTNLVTECLADSIDRLEECKLTVHLHEAPQVFVRIDRDMMTRIIHNLIRNCITHAVDNMEVQVSKDQNAVLIFRNSVENPATIEVKRLFDRFYTADRARTKTTGLGLSIVKLLAERMNGSTSAELRDGVIEIRVELPLGDT